MSERLLLNFAYGSNMAPARLLARLPAAEYRGVVTLEGYRLTFNMLAHDGSTKCDIEKAHGERVYGVIYALTNAEKQQLDAIEGERYDCVEVTVTCQAAQTFTAFAYIANTHDANVLPYDWYLQHVVKGAEQAQLPTDYIARIKATSVQPDSDRLRAAREYAVHR
ncbi:gamma-glutamylcyclotransferase family protein [Pseudoalteromonas fenneropenaei]|uniref:Gamma-glutamylcyclotransferase family protein n=1 Tax=Pseudoalteromonas fenneropenaei TaxID=1737459 RepID=A0ABV7CKM0_9GAMM